MKAENKLIKPLVWVGRCLKDLKNFPPDVQDQVGYALHTAQIGEKSPAAKPLKGFLGGGVLEVIENFDGDTYRVVYTVRFKKAVFALHAFQKKSKKGISTPKIEVELISKRLSEAKTIYQAYLEQQDEEEIT